MTTESDRHSLTETVEELLAQARTAHSGRASRTLRGAAGHRLRHTVIALQAGATLSDHESPGEATLQVLSGTVRLTTDTAEQRCDVGDLVDIPPVRHGLTADDDAAVLLTVALTSA